MDPGQPWKSFDGLHQEQLEALEEALFEAPGRVVVLCGEPGAGKTSLACLFANLHRDRFPGGTPFLTATADIDADAVLEQVPDSRALLLLDEGDRVRLSVLASLIARIRETRPLASVLMTARYPIFVHEDMVAVQIPPLTTPQIIDLLTRQTGVSSQRFEDLANVLAGNTAAAAEASRRLASGVDPERIIEWLVSGELASALDPAGHELLQDSPERTRLDVAVSEVGDALIEELAGRPELLYELDPRKFEKLVAELYRRQGFEATLTPASGDEGVDIYVVSRNDLGRTLWVVQAKRHAAERPIEAGVVRELYGTVMAKDASAGILVTTSFFQPGAVKLERQFEYRLSLKDYLDLQELLRRPSLPQ